MKITFMKAHCVFFYELIEAVRVNSIYSEIYTVFRFGNRARLLRVQGSHLDTRGAKTTNEFF